MCFKPPFCRDCWIPSGKNSLGDKRCNASPVIWENLLWRIIPRLYKLRKEFEIWFLEKRCMSFVFCFFFSASTIWCMFEWMKRSNFFLLKLLKIMWKNSTTILPPFFCYFYFIFLLKGMGEIFSLHLLFWRLGSNSLFRIKTKGRYNKIK